LSRCRLAGPPFEFRSSDFFRISDFGLRVYCPFTPIPSHRAIGHPLNRQTGADLEAVLLAFHRQQFESMMNQRLTNAKAQHGASSARAEAEFRVQPQATIR